MSSINAQNDYKKLSIKKLDYPQRARDALIRIGMSSRT